ncbi:hypothetical protein HMPREF9123_1906 [Neisseria bacilliformis ATCC BAA-1200]|uniref:Uncharacterized protein n=1 Tax=Neisseria bacilliformis ATCC BAA-1200 TaxID=888742 RepID=F2BDV0_9NEIS|nr:hypothetical protein HMPREF9123_1906 [Neisseria bacilliformis ATCC BAA-1200]
MQHTLIPPSDLQKTPFPLRLRPLSGRGGGNAVFTIFSTKQIRQIQIL